MTRKEFGASIKEIRSKHNLTMQEFADSIGAKKSAVNMWENANVIPREELLIKISEVYNVSLDDLLVNRAPIVGKLSYIQRGLSKMDDTQLKEAEDVLKRHFKEIYEMEEKDDDI